MVLLVKLECFAVCFGLTVLGNNLQSKKGRKEFKYWKIASLSQTHLEIFTKCTSIFTVYTHSWRHCQLVAFIWFVTIVSSLKLYFQMCFKARKVGKMAKIWENRASLANHNILQNLQRYFTLYGISCWRAPYSWFGATVTLSRFVPFDHQHFL